jgi:glucose/arabinose dehydrogenase
MTLIAKISAGARELAVAPNGDLFVGTGGSQVYIVPAADSTTSNPGPPAVFADLHDSPAAGVALDTTAKDCALYVGTQFGVYRIPYTIGDQTAQSKPVKIASVRPGGSSDHSTTSVAVVGSTLYASVGSSCDACTETDPTRATVQQMALDGSGMSAKAVHIRNAITLAVNPNTGTLWAGGAGQDSLPRGHPYEYLDALTLHAGVADYGWPNCEENRIAYRRGSDCSNVVVPRIEFPAYETIIGAAFYPASPSGAYRLPAQYAGGVFVAMHGSWHTQNGVPIAPPRIAFVPMRGDSPVTNVDWSDPTKQWSDFISGFQSASGARIGRPTGVAVGPQGGLFIGDDQTGNIYRIRP